MQINWLIPFEGPEGFPIPTYGKYGGVNWSGGKFVADTEPGDYSVQPEDPLDRKFRKHDMAYDQPDKLLRAFADIKLIKGIQGLDENAVTGEGDAYGGAAILAMLYQVAVVNKHPELLLTLDIEGIVNDAVDLIHQGSITPEPNEVAGLVSWLGELSVALASVNHPITDRLAEELADLVESIGPNGEPVFPIVLADVSFDFGTEEALALLAQKGVNVEKIADFGKLGDFVEDFLGGKGVADLVDALPDGDHAPLAVLADKLSEFHCFGV
ncbi:hypothetical protein [Microvirga aerophila]|uniref:Uncharacterized protein n=1 Tax=Microvirga aerophila TaxID=670291 RepID=A0A512BND6_9HYPH|nr:hypothetical protein [Microvirga aerophila]GEO13468.1 hypothetical protein MAE02_11640 [Microvirga aerophila]